MKTTPNIESEVARARREMDANKRAASAPAPSEPTGPAPVVGSGGGVGVWKQWKSRWAEYRRKKAEDDLMWDYWMAKDAYERGDITAKQFFYDERFFTGWKAAHEKKEAEQTDPNT